MLRAAFDHRSRVEQYGRFLAGWNDRGERGTFDAGEAAEGADGGHHRRTSVAGAEQSRGAAVTDRFTGKLDRRTRLSTQRGGGWLRHVDVFGGVENLEVE